MEADLDDLTALERLKVDQEPRCLLVVSEPFATITTRGYQVAIAVYERKKRRQYQLLIGSKSLTEQIAPLVEENDGRFKGLEFWLRKESSDRFAKYVVE